VSVFSTSAGRRRFAIDVDRVDVGLLLLFPLSAEALLFADENVDNDEDATKAPLSKLSLLCILLPISDDTLGELRFNVMGVLCDRCGFGALVKLT
jgi:hypothetical protein